MNPPSQTGRRQYESVGDAAARIGVSTKSVRRWIASGQLAGYRWGLTCSVLIPMTSTDRRLTLIPTARAI